MRIHSVALTAFGPYGGDEFINFDELNEAGIFLLAGPTGAGKTSLLDAVCFALYGTVPGAREAKGVRSDHADPATRTRVAAELTVRGQRWRVERRPEHPRPKKRGVGSTKDPASGRLWRIDNTDGAEATLHSDRLDEIGHTLGELLQMSSEQFAQVVLLPQGGFQKFLLASSQDRKAVLERLFSTERFGAIERHLAVHAKQVREAAEDERLTLDKQLASLGSRCDIAAPDLRDGSQDAASVAEWLIRLEHEVCARDETAEKKLLAAQHAYDLAFTQHRSETERLQRLSRRSQAASTIAAIGRDECADQAAHKLERHLRAVQISSHLAEHRLARESYLAQHHRTHSAVAALSHLRCPAAPQQLPVVSKTASQFETDPLVVLGEIENAQGIVAGWDVALESCSTPLIRLRELAVEVSSASIRCEHLVAALQEAETASAELPAVVEAMRNTLARDRSSAEGLPAAHEGLEHAQRVLAAAQSLKGLETDERGALTFSLEARERLLAARGHLLQLTHKRWEQMAAVLASDLKTGEACVVCGSADHPAPAPPASQEVSDAALRMADERVSALDLEVAASADALDSARRLATEARTRCEGYDLPQALARVQSARAQLALAGRAAGSVADTATKLAELEDRLSRHERSRREAAARAAEGQVALKALEQEQSRLWSTVAALWPPDLPVRCDLRVLDSCVADARTFVAEVRSGLDSAESSARGFGSAAQSLAHTTATCQRLSAENGFHDPDDAQSALLGTETVDRLTTIVAERESRLQASTATLADVPGDDEFPDGPRGVEELSLQVHQVEQQFVNAKALMTSSQAERTSACEELTAVSAALPRARQALAAWLPLHHKSFSVSGLAQVVNGQGANQLKTPLAAYVLAQRLDLVLEAANGRLTAMEANRYTLRRTGSGGGNRKAGLDLEVVDLWTGVPRPVSSLSGGELFIASLSLALGLADVVSAESGGIAIDSLFIDEGFGSLDADALDSVMGALDQLRAGGRTVGLISHVADLRQRIPAQLVVEMTPRGSTIRPLAIVG